ncbi:MAG TPA: carbohydrate-binding module family 20 domain-containing protein [Thermoanaerobaculia bacterium]|nr:carbohydrate-binding module family 20 domain-containing protein [Thermoanaerobaculia bacterium]
MCPFPSARSLRAPLLALFACLSLSAVPAGAQTPLGATLVSGGVQFAVFTQNATRIEVWLFSSPTASTPTARHTMTKTDTVNHVWTVTVSAAGAGTLYGLRAWGPNWPYSASWTAGSNVGFVSHVDGSGNRFNPNKLLMDPYAKAVTGEPLRVVGGDGQAHYSTAILGGTNTYAFVDSAGAMPKSIVIDDAAFAWGADSKPQTPMKDSIAYEVHLRGFTRNDSSLSAVLRGTYDGFGARASFFTGLGVTAVELLPVHEYLQFDDPVGGAAADRTNYWGYMTTQFFAPNREYLCTDVANCTLTAGQQVNEFKEMVKAAHAQGIEVWLDVVFNHTAEGGACAGNAVRYLSFRGLDNASYYTLGDDKSCYWETTGTGNNLNASRPAVRRLILDSLTYWADVMRVDGFRFDLAYTLGREGADGRVFNANAQTLLDVAQLAQTKAFKVVAEAWDTAGYGVGQFPAGWSEWNGFYRDNVRRFGKGDAAQVGGLGASITGTWSGFAEPEESVNFVTAHDGFTLADLVAYNTKQNGVGPCNPTGADPSSGSDANDSWDSGGDEVLRRRQIRNFATQLLIDHGVPMLLGGDELRRTQSGNNNGYMADNACGWYDWSLLNTNSKQYQFFRKLAALRKAHPGLRRSSPVSGSDHDGDGLADLRWHGTSVGAPDWSSSSRSIAFQIDGGSAETGGSPDAPDLYVAYNAYWGNLTFNLPSLAGGQCWWLVADTADWAEGTGNVYFDPAVSAWNSQLLPKVAGTSWGVQARSSLVLAARPCTAGEAVRVDFTVNGFVTQPGQDLYVVGNKPELGNWDVTKAVRLNWVDTDTWSGPVFFTGSKGQTIEYKYIMRQGGSTTWETGANRTYTVPASGSGSRNENWRF